MQNKILNACNCTDPLALSLFNSTTCETVSQQTCMNNQYAIIFNTNYITSTCIPLCPLECQKAVFKTSVSFLEVIGDLYYDYIRNNSNLSSDFVNTVLTKDSAQDSFSYVYLYYNTNSYTITTESPNMDAVSLLANIGGTLGLFLGISLMQICELVDVLIQILLIKTNPSLFIENKSKIIP